MAFGIRQARTVGVGHPEHVVHDFGSRERLLLDTVDDVQIDLFRGLRGREHCAKEKERRSEKCVSHNSEGVGDWQTFIGAIRPLWVTGTYDRAATVRERGLIAARGNPRSLTVAALL